MKQALCVLAVALLTMASAAPKFVGPVKLGEGRIHYADSHADYIYRFGTDGTYNRTFVHKGGSDPGYNEGKYVYKRTGTKTATLQMDDEKWTLKWNKPNRADIKIEGDERTYVAFWEE